MGAVLAERQRVREQALIESLMGWEPWTEQKHMEEGKKTGVGRRRCSRKELILENEHVSTTTGSGAESQERHESHPVLCCQQILIKTFRQNMFQPHIMKRLGPPSDHLSWASSAPVEEEGV